MSHDDSRDPRVVEGSRKATDIPFGTLRDHSPRALIVPLEFFHSSHSENSPKEVGPRADGTLVRGQRPPCSYNAV